MNMPSKSKSNGFTLIELVVVLVLLSIIGVFGSLFLINMVRSYKWAEDNAHLAQKAQVALTRIAVELATTDQTVSFTGTSLTYGDRSVGRHSGESYLRLATGGADLSAGNILVNRVTNFSVTKPGSHLFEISLELTGDNGAPQQFVTHIATVIP